MFPIHIAVNNCYALRPSIIAKMIEYYISKDIHMSHADRMISSIWNMDTNSTIYFSVDYCDTNYPKNSRVDQIKIDIPHSEAAVISFVPRERVYKVLMEFGEIKYTENHIKDRLTFLSQVDNNISLTSYMQENNISWNDITKITFKEW